MHRLPPMTRPNLGRRALAEGLAAFALVFAGCGAIVADATRDGALGTVGVGLVFGLVIMAMVYATGHLSGAHINPAVTIAFTLTRHFPARDALAYVGGQLLGSTDAGILRITVSADATLISSLTPEPTLLGVQVLQIGNPRLLGVDLPLDIVLFVGEGGRSPQDERERQ